MSTADKWAGFHLLAFDLETTGIDYRTDRICTAALVDVIPGKRPVATTYITDPGIEIPAEASAVNGLTRDWLTANQTHTPEQLAFEISARLARHMGQGQPVVIFNGAFDFTMLEAENLRHRTPTLLARMGQSSKLAPILDVYVLDKAADKFRKGGRKLGQVCAQYGVVHVGEHDATADALATARVLPKLMAKHARKFPGFTLQSLHSEQVVWRREQMDGLRAYFDRMGTPHDGCDPGWPVYLGMQRYYAGEQVPA